MGIQCNKEVNWAYNKKSCHMVLKGVSWVHINNIRINGLETAIWVQNSKTRSYGLERSQKTGHMCDTVKLISPLFTIYMFGFIVNNSSLYLFKSQIKVL